MKCNNQILIEENAWKIFPNIGVNILQNLNFPSKAQKKSFIFRGRG